MLPIKILLCEDDAEKRNYLLMLMQGYEAFEVVGSFEDGETAVSEVEKLDPDVVIMDIELPGISGIESTSQIKEILPDLVEIGLTVYNPVQPEVIDHMWLRETFGDRLAYYGGVSTQTVLVDGSPEEVEVATEECIRTLAPDHTGIIIGPSHRMMSDIPVINIEAMLRSPSIFQ